MPGIQEGIENSKNYSILRSFLVFGPIFITFNLTDVTNSSAVVLVTLTLENATPSPGCWVDSLTFRGKTFPQPHRRILLHQRLQTGQTHILHPPPLQPPPRKEEPTLQSINTEEIWFYGGGDLKVNNVTFAQDKLVHTFVRTFRPPLVRIRSNWLPIIYQKKAT